jgi:hypothetical protein
MINSPLLNVAIGLAYIFFLYSLIATSIKESIATSLGLRSSMLKRGIAIGMLSNTSTDLRWVSMAKGLWGFVKGTVDRIGLLPKKKEEDKNLGDKFFDHPLIKNYGSSRIYPTPSYIPADNFSTVLVDILKSDFQDKLGIIADAECPPAATGEEDDRKKAVAAVMTSLNSLSDVMKIKKLLGYYDGEYKKADRHEEAIESQKAKSRKKAADGKNVIMVIAVAWLVVAVAYTVAAVILGATNRFSAAVATVAIAVVSVAAVAIIVKINAHKPKPRVRPSFIDRETLGILQMQLRNSLYSLDDFKKSLEDWFNDSMDRVSGWYKRQVQFILFFLGFIMAMTLNVDIIQIATTLSKDKDARDKMVELAQKDVDNYKNDPRVMHILSNSNVKPDDPQLQPLYKEYKDKMDAVKAIVDTDANSPTSMLALGWKDFGLSVDGPRVQQQYAAELEDNLSTLHDRHKDYSDSICYKLAVQQIYDHHWMRLKVGYVFSQTFSNGLKILGFLILSFAVCLGAPFWFDLLSKFVQLRGSGKKEGGSDNSAPPAKPPTGGQQPGITINNASPGQEAVG